MYPQFSQFPDEPDPSVQDHLTGHRTRHNPACALCQDRQREQAREERIKEGLPKTEWERHLIDDPFCPLCLHTREEEDRQRQKEEERGEENYVSVNISSPRLKARQEEEKERIKVKINEDLVETVVAGQRARKMKWNEIISPAEKAKGLTSKQRGIIAITLGFFLAVAGIVWMVVGLHAATFLGALAMSAGVLAGYGVLALIIYFTEMWVLRGR